MFFSGVITAPLEGLNIQRLLTSRFKSATFGQKFVVLFLLLRDNWVFMVFNKLKNFYDNNIWPSVRLSDEDAGNDRPSVQPSLAAGAMLTHSVSISKHQLLRHKRLASGRLPEPQYLAGKNSWLDWPLNRLSPCGWSAPVPFGWNFCLFGLEIFFLWLEFFPNLNT